MKNFFIWVVDCLISIATAFFVGQITRMICADMVCTGVVLFANLSMIVLQTLYTYQAAKIIDNRVCYRIRSVAFLVAAICGFAFTPFGWIVATLSNSLTIVCIFVVFAVAFAIIYWPQIKEAIKSRTQN